MRRTGMMAIRDILKHRHDFGLARAQIVAAVGVSTGTVSHILERAAAVGLSWPLPPDLDDAALRARLYPLTERDGKHVQPDWEALLDPRPKSADNILDSIKRFCLRTLDTAQRQTEIIKTSESGH